MMQIFISIVLFVAILALYRTAMDTGWSMPADVLSAACAAFLLQFLINPTANL